MWLFVLNLLYHKLQWNYLDVPNVHTLIWMYARHSVYIRTVFVHNTIVYPLTQEWDVSSVAYCLLLYRLLIPQEMNHNITTLLLCLRLDQTACRMMIMLGGKREFWGGLIADTTLLHLGECAICDITCYLSWNMHFGKLPILGASCNSRMVRPKE